jgi:hypothetical protein
VLAKALSDQKHSVGHVKVSHFLNDLGYRLQGNRKTEEGDDHPDRDAQFRHINAQVRQAMKKGEAVISVDTKRTSSSATLRTKGGSGEEASCRSRSTATIFPVLKFRAPIRMGFTISGRIQDSSMSARTMIRAHSQWPPSGGGASGRMSALSQRRTSAHYGGRRKHQRLSSPALEMGVATLGGSDGIGAIDPSLSAGNQQME